MYYIQLISITSTIEIHKTYPRNYIEMSTPYTFHYNFHLKKKPTHTQHCHKPHFETDNIKPPIQNHHRQRSAHTQFRHRARESRRTLSATREKFSKIQKNMKNDTSCETRADSVAVERVTRSWSASKVQRRFARGKRDRPHPRCAIIIRLVLSGSFGKIVLVCVHGFTGGTRIFAGCLGEKSWRELGGNAWSFVSVDARGLYGV